MERVINKPAELNNCAMLERVEAPDPRGCLRGRPAPVPL